MSKAEIFYRLLEKEQGYYEAILEITQQENHKFMNARPFNEILPFIKRKKILLACIDDIEVVLDPIKTWWTVNKNDENLWTDKVKRQLKTLENIVQDILDLDKMNQNMCLSRRSSLKEKCQQAIPLGSA